MVRNYKHQRCDVISGLWKEKERSLRRVDAQGIVGINVVFTHNSARRMPRLSWSVKGVASYSRGNWLILCTTDATRDFLTMCFKFYLFTIIATEGAAKKRNFTRTIPWMYIHIYISLSSLFEPLWVRRDCARPTVDSYPSTAPTWDSTATWPVDDVNEAFDGSAAASCWSITLPSRDLLEWRTAQVWDSFMTLCPVKWRPRDLS